MAEHGTRHHEHHDNSGDGRDSLPPIWKKTCERAINLRVYKNGDHFFAGKNVTLHKGKQRNFDAWMVELSNNMRMRQGAVWRLYTPKGGRPVKSFDSLEDGCGIVAAGNEGFKPYGRDGYAQIDPHPKRGGPPRNFDPFTNNHKSRIAASGRIRKIEIHGKIIKCWANGNKSDPAKHILLDPPSHGPLTLQSVQDKISARLSNLCGGAVDKLYTPDGQLVVSMDQIVSNGHYIAAKKSEGFKPGIYNEAGLRNFEGGRSPPPSRRNNSVPPLRSNKTSSQSSPEHSTRRERPPRREENGGPLSRPVKHKPNSYRSSQGSSEKAREVDYDEDKGGVFRAKNGSRETQGARQVEDTRHTRTELPIDQRRAEEVQEEDIGKKDKKGKKDQRITNGDSPPDHGNQRTYRANARRANSPGEDQRRRERESQARARREQEDRDRQEKARQQREAAQQKRKEKEDRKKEEEEERKRATEKKRGSKPQGRRTERRQSSAERHQTQRNDTSSPRRNDTLSPRRTPSPTRRNSQRKDSRTDTEDRRRDQAVTTISRHVRGHQARQRVHAMRQGRDRQLNESIGYGRNSSRNSSLNRDEPLPVEDNDDWGNPPASGNNMEEEEQAARTLQAGFRGYKARQDVHAMRAQREVKREEEEEEEDERGGGRSPPQSSAPEMISQSEAEAATKIQAAYRGHRTRRDLEREG